MRIKNEYICHGNDAQIVINSPKYGIFYALIDVEDLEKVKKHQWHIHVKRNRTYFYPKTKIDNKLIALHTFVTNRPDDMVVDHINHNTLDNRKANLKICTTQANLQNRRPNKNNTSGVTGVSYSNPDKKWIVDICDTRIGKFKNFEDAIIARKNAEKVHFKNLA